MENKPWYLSRTIWGAVVALIGLVSPKGVEALGGPTATDTVMVAVGLVAELVGLVMVVLGRAKATGPLTK